MSDESYGIAMPTMDLKRGDKLQINEEQITAHFNSEEFIKKDEEWVEQKRTNFAFGGMNVKDRIKNRKMKSSLANQAQQIEKLLQKR